MMNTVRTLLSVCVLAMWMLAAAPAAGHSVMERSDPAPNAVLDSSPRQVLLRFSEPIDPTFATVTVHDEAGRSISGATSVSADGRMLTAPLLDVSRGVLTVRWRVLSALDGHTTTGFFVVSVGRALPANAARSYKMVFPLLLRVAVRWLGYLAAIFLAGCIAFEVFALRPGLRRLPLDDVGDLAVVTARALHQAAVGAAGLLAVALAVDLLLQLAELTAGPVLEARGALVAFLFGTRPGWSALVQAGMAGLILVPRSPRGRVLQASAVWLIILIVGIMTLLGGPAAVVASTHLALLVLVSSVYALLGLWAAFILPQVTDVRIPQMAGVPVVAGAGLLMGIALRSHAAGDGIMAVLSDCVHLAAGALWIGGLASLWITLHAAPSRRRSQLAGAIVPHLSRLSAVGLVTILATGLYAAWVNVPTAEALVATTYGRVLLGKVAVVAVITGLGAYNRFVLRPALEGAGQRLGQTVKTFSRSITAETALGAVALLAVAALTMTPPARVTYRPQRLMSVAMSGTTDGVKIGVRISPSGPGVDRFEVSAGDANGPLPIATAVRLRLTKLDEDLAPATILLAAYQGGRYTAEGGYLLDGWWEIGVIVRRMGRVDAVATFPFMRDVHNAATTDAEAERLLTQARATAANVRSWREDEQSSDGHGEVRTQIEYQPPRRLRYRTSSGLEGVLVGSAHYVREDGGPWRQSADVPTRSFDGAGAYLSGAQAARLGRRATCPDEDCQVVLWESADRAARFVGWIGISSGRLTRLFMIAGTRSMTLDVSGVNTPIHIDAPR